MNQSHWLSILGIGEDGIEGLSDRARALLRNARLVVGGARHLDLAASVIDCETMVWPCPIEAAIPTILARRGEAVVVLASGDPFFFGVGPLIARAVARDEFICLPGISSASLAASRLGWALDRTDVISCCGRPVETLIPALYPGARLLVLSTDAATPHAIGGLLRNHGFGASRLHVLEALGGPREKIRDFAASEPLPHDVAPLNLVAIETTADADAPLHPRAPGLPEAVFAHDGQITRREIRAATIAALSPRPGNLLWDIGCGSGSVGIEWMLNHPANRAIGLERDPTRAERARGNARALGVPGFDIRDGSTAEGLSGWPIPDAVFIGGGAQRDGMIETCLGALRPGGRIVVNAVTIETEATLFAAHATHGGTLTRLTVDRLDKVGRFHGFRPAMTVTQWRTIAS